MIFCPSYWYQEIADPMTNLNPRSESQLLDALCLTRAVEANAALIYCNAAGVMKNPDDSIDTLIGHSQAVIPAIGPLQRIESSDERLVTVDLDLSHLMETEKIYRA